MQRIQTEMLLVGTKAPGKVSKEQQSLDPIDPEPLPWFPVEPCKLTEPQPVCKELVAVT